MKSTKAADRFGRAPVIGRTGKPYAPRMTPRQAAILLFVAQNRFCTFDQILACYGGDARALRGNVRLLRGDNVGYIKQAVQDVEERSHTRAIRYEIDDRGAAYLYTEGLIAEPLQRPNVTNFKHATLATDGTASIEVGIAYCPYATLIDWPKIKMSKSIPERTRASAHPFGIPYADEHGEVHYAIADSPPFGIKLELEDRNKFRFFPGIEADTGTKKESKMVDQFAGYLNIEKSLAYKDHFGFPENTFFVPFLVKSLYEVNRVEWLKRILSEMTDGRGSKSIIFMRYQPNATPGYLFTEPWERVGYGDVRLNA